MATGAGCSSARRGAMTQPARFGSQLRSSLQETGALREVEVAGRVVGVVVAMLASGVLAGAAVAAEVPNPTVEGPIEGGAKGYAWNHSLVPLRGDGYDYTEREYFFGGTATNLSSGAAAPYKTRMLVRLPRDAKDFKGTVVVEWLNVTATYDLETGWPTPSPGDLLRPGIGLRGGLPPGGR